MSGGGVARGGYVDSAGGRAGGPRFRPQRHKSGRCHRGTPRLRRPTVRRSTNPTDPPDRVRWGLAWIQPGLDGACEAMVAMAAAAGLGGGASHGLLDLRDGLGAGGWG